MPRSKGVKLLHSLIDTNLIGADTRERAETVRFCEFHCQTHISWVVFRIDVDGAGRVATADG
ncbi:hypothetical protein GCM10011487_11890 [Steroidobacter agaridevorans]|uniref:Uncharacterized protein n=1 Tax=Steroidobacter agaridevorans TaxID=2695856 RepID=A0A829Y7H3_9GAMM|nr:hypothetical protein GCM10011487_11890 [Steroidobacter agaridevorans]